MSHLRSTTQYQSYTSITYSDLHGNLNHTYRALHKPNLHLYHLLRPHGTKVTLTQRYTTPNLHHLVRPAHLLVIYYDTNFFLPKKINVLLWSYMQLQVGKVYVLLSPYSRTLIGLKLTFALAKLNQPG